MPIRIVCVLTKRNCPSSKVNADLDVVANANIAFACTADTGDTNSVDIMMKDTVTHAYSFQPLLKYISEPM